MNNFFVQKFEALMGYQDGNYILSDENVLFFHLSISLEARRHQLAQESSLEEIDRISLLGRLSRKKVK